MPVNNKVVSFPAVKTKTRGNRLWERALKQRKQAKLSLARALLVTASYKETEGLSTPIRRAKAFEKIMAEIPIFIETDDLLAGAFSAKPMYFEWYPEFTVDQDMLSQDLKGMLAEGYRSEDMAEVIHYFKDRCFQGSFLSRLNDAQKQRMAEACEDGAWVYRSKTTLDIDRGYHATDHKKVVEKGFLEVLAEVNQTLGNTEAIDDESYRRRNFLQGLAIVLKAGIHYARRHAVLARELSAGARGKRKATLIRIAENCERVPAHPARNFYEAVQASWFLHVMIHLESRAQESLGRMDHFLYPFYQRDKVQGNITAEAAIDILECLRVKMSSLRLFSSVRYSEIVSGEAQYHNVTLGGQTPDGRDDTNELSYLFLEAAARTRTPHPTLSIRYHDKMAKDFALKGVELVKKGLGFPAFFNDRSSIAWLLAQGVPLDVARGHCISGCVHPTVPGQTSPFDALFISIPKCLELAFYNGFDPRTKKQVGPQTGAFCDMQTFEALIDSFKAQTLFFSEEGGAMIRLQKIARSQMVPAMLSSAFTDDCIQKGKTCLADGARYNIIIQIPVGIIDAIDSLAAVKKCVFEDKTVTQTELLEALSANFASSEKLRKTLLDAPKYGNDDDFVDSIAAEVYGWWGKMVADIDGPYGVKQLPAPYSVSAHGAAGKRTGALPSGRLSEQPFADGSVSPFPGMDVKGPTAVINSAGKIDQIPLFSSLLNMKFHPSALKDEQDLNNLLALIKTYFDYGGKHIQFNVVDSRTLREAQVHPEKYRNLMVRVAGYSALFTELTRNIQDEIIMRTEFNATQC